MFNRIYEDKSSYPLRILAINIFITNVINFFLENISKKIIKFAVLSSKNYMKSKFKKEVFKNMKIIGVVGSPRRESNTEILVKEVLDGANKAGAETKIFKLSQMEISPCKACMYCKSSEGQCATDDDMQVLYKEIKEADGFVLSSPIYMWQMTAQSKLFTDRLYAFYGTNFEEQYGKKKISLIFSQGNPDKNAFNEYFNYTRNMFEFLGFQVVDMKNYANNNIPGSVNDQDEVLGEAREIGVKMVETQ